MARLPQPGGDNGNWGSILNEYLTQSHNADGTIKDDVVTAGSIVDGTISEAQLASAVQTKLNASTTDATSSTKGILRLTNHLGGTADSPTVPGLASKVAKGELVVNVMDYGAVGNGSSDDTVAIQTAINSSANGATIYFPAGTYIVTAPVILKPRRSYVGGGTAYSDGATIKQADGSNITNGAGLSAILAAEAWSANASACDDPVMIENLCIDGNSANNPSSSACGIVLVNHHSHISRCLVNNSPLHGIHLTDTTANGSNIVSNSCSENRITECKIDVCGGHGISQLSANTISNQDGHCIDNNIASTAGSGIFYNRGSGWIFRRNHLYTIAKHGIMLENSFATNVVDNEIEDFGSEAANGEYYTGIGVIQLNGRGTTVIGNFVGCHETSNSVGGYQYFSLNAGPTQTDAWIVAADNIAHGPDSFTSKGVALVFQGYSGGVLHLHHSHTAIENIQTELYNDGNAKLYVNDSTGRQHTVVGSTTSSFGGPARGSGAPSVTLAGSDMQGALSFGTGTGASAGMIGGLTFENQFGSTPVITLTAGNAATAALGLYVNSFASYCEFGVLNAPLDSQAAGAYVIYYRVG
jgi:hypothetical protein